LRPHLVKIRQSKNLLICLNSQMEKLPKIYYVANLRFPTEKAHGIQLAKMCEAFLDGAADLQLVIPGRRSISESPKEFYGLKYSIPTKKLPILDIYSWGRLGFTLASLSFAVCYFLYLLRKKMKGERFIVYTIDMDQFSFFLVPCIGVPYFVEVHDAKRKNFFYSFLFKNAKGVIVINQLIKETLIKEFKLTPDKIIVHSNGIDLKQFDIAVSYSEARQKLWLPLDRHIALYVGKVYDWKGMEILVDAAPNLDANTYLYLVGATESELHKIGNGKLVANMVCVGQRDYKEIPLWLKAADVLLVLGTKQNEYSYYHTSPMKMFEYMASRTLIVASKTPAVMQAVSDAEVVFYEPDNSKDLAEKIRYVLQNSLETSEKINNAFAKVTNLTWQKRANSIINFITENI